MTGTGTYLLPRIAPLPNSHSYFCICTGSKAELLHYCLECTTSFSDKSYGELPISPCVSIDLLVRVQHCGRHFSSNDLETAGSDEEELIAKTRYLNIFIILHLFLFLIHSTATLFFIVLSLKFPTKYSHIPRLTPFD